MTTSNDEGCRAALNIKGEHFPCDEGRPHSGIHGSVAAGAIWASDTEVRSMSESIGARQ